MWQRIQTLWWLLSIIAVALFASQNILLYSFGGEVLPSMALRSYGMVELPDGNLVGSSYPLVVLSGLSIVISAVSIAIYKMRTFQLRLSILNALILFGTMCLLAFMAYQDKSSSEGVGLGVTLWTSLPLVGIILQVLAARAVLQDEMLVRMSNRIR